MRQSAGVKVRPTSGKATLPLAHPKVPRAAVPDAACPRPFTPSNLLVEKLV